MIVFDLLLLLSAAALLGLKSLYLGSVALVIGLLIGFQSERTIRLLGSETSITSTSRKIKALFLSLVIGVGMGPFLWELPTPGLALSAPWSQESVLPLVIITGLFAAALTAALTVEKRKR